MKKTKHRVLTRILSAAIAAVMVCGVLLTNGVSVSAAAGTTKDLIGIISDVLADNSRTSKLVNSDGQTVATVEIKYGSIVDGEKNFSYDGENIKNDDGKIINTWEWTTEGFLKIQMQKNATLRFYNPEFVGSAWYSWTTVSLMKARDGVKSSLFTSPETNPNGEGVTSYTWKESTFFDKTVSVKAGDTLYLCIQGNEWGCYLSSGALKIQVLENAASDALSESVSAGTMIYNVAQSKGGMVENSGLTSYTIKTGTIERRIDFETFADDMLSFGDAKSFITPTQMRVDQDYSIIYQVNILQDCNFRFTHPSAPRGSWAAAYTMVQIWRTTDVGTEKLSDITISNLKVPENYYCPDVYEAKAGETYFMVYRTSNSYYGATDLSVGYEASVSPKTVPENESVVAGDAIGSGKLSGALYSISFATGDNHAAASGSAFTATNVTVPNGGRESIVITALKDIRLELAATGADRIVLEDGSVVNGIAHLAADDKVYVEFTNSGAYTLTFTADRTRYVSGARHNGEDAETYDLYDMINQMAFMGETTGPNLRRLSTFTVESGKLGRNQSSLMLSDAAAGKFTSREGGANTGVIPIWYGDSMGLKLLADTGFDTIVTVTATKDALVSMTFPVLTVNANWALGTYVKALVMDADGTTVQLYNKIVPEFPEADYFAASANLQAGQSLLMVYYTPTGLYGAVDILPTFTIDTTAYDASQLTDFAEARELKGHKDSAIAELTAYAEAKDENNYTGEKWLELESILQEGIDQISDAADADAISTLLAEYKAKLDAVETSEAQAAELNAYKAQKIAELDEFMKTLNRKDYSSANWKKIQDFYTAGKDTINKQTSKTKVDNAFTSVKTSIEKVEKGGYSDSTTTIIIVAAVAAVVIAAGVTAFILIRKKKKPAEDTKDNS